MKRLLLHTIILLSVLVSGCINLKLKTDVVQDESDWYTEGGNQSRNHQVDAIIDPPLEEKWRVDVGAGVGSGGALIIDHVVLVGTRKGHIMAVDLNTGKRLGRARFDAPIEGSMAYQSEVLFIPLISKKKTIVAYNISSGEQLWKKNSTPIESGLLARDNVLVTVDTEGYIRGLNVDDGEVIWELQTGERTGIISSPILIDNNVAVANENGDIFLFNLESGKEIWSERTGYPVHASLSANEDHVFMPTTRGKLLAFSGKSGDLSWVYALPDTTVRFAAPGYDDKTDLVVVGSTDGMVRALDARDGAAKWETSVEGAISIAPLFTGNTIYIGTMRGKVYALDKNTGEKIWEHEVTGRVKSAMAARDGKLVVLAETQQLFMFSPDEEEQEISP